MVKGFLKKWKKNLRKINIARENRRATKNHQKNSINYLWLFCTKMVNFRYKQRREKEFSVALHKFQEGA